VTHTDLVRGSYVPVHCGRMGPVEYRYDFKR
jgi:hypothetical protein